MHRLALVFIESAYINIPRKDFTSLLQVDPIRALVKQGVYIPWESGEEPGGKLFRIPAELFAGQSSSENPAFGQLGYPAWLETISDNLPSIIKDQKDAVMQCLHLWLVFSPYGVAFTDPSLPDRYSMRVCSLIAPVLFPVTVFAAGHG